MKKLVTYILVGWFLNGCSTSGGNADWSNGGAEVVSSNPRSVVIWVGANYFQEAQKAADTECKKYGRYAQRVDSSRGDKTKHFFNCVQ